MSRKVGEQGLGNTECRRFAELVKFKRIRDDKPGLLVGEGIDAQLPRDTINDQIDMLIDAEIVAWIEIADKPYSSA